MLSLYQVIPSTLMSVNDPLELKGRVGCGQNKPHRIDLCSVADENIARSSVVETYSRCGCFWDY